MPDRLSDLPDDLLIHILSFAPLCEAASTTPLSRRWRRPLWLDTGVLLLDHLSYATTSGDALPRRMLEDADRALELYDSLGRNPTKFTMLMRGTVDEDDNDDEDDEEDQDRDDKEEGSEEEEELDGVEELRLEWLDCASPVHCRNEFSPASLPYAPALRVLEITGFILQPESNRKRALALPCLEAMRLRRCRTAIATLNRMIYAAPRLVDIRLDAVCFVDNQHEYELHCPKATDIVISDLNVFRSGILFGGCTVKLDAPCVRRLRYANVVTFEETYFALEPRLPPNLEHVHLVLHSGSTRATLVRRALLTSVHNIRFLKLTSYSLADLDDIMQCSFFNLQRLEIEDTSGWCVRNDIGVASALVNMLSRCPGLRELQLKFSWREYLRNNMDQTAASSDFSPCRAVVNKAGQNCCNGLGIRKICCGSKLECLQSSLRKVALKFDTQELTCL
ncbi:unnamed protein product [Alopecurus aequalis]